MFLNAVNDDVKPLLFEAFPNFLTKRENFYLAGGTALALHLGHRKSADIDFFSMKEFGVEALSVQLTRLGGSIQIAEEGTIHAFIGRVKVSFLYYPYHLLKGLHLYERISIAALEDIACMKVIAISQRSEKKDFYDLYEILHLLTPAELGSMVLEKYGRDSVNCFHILKSFFYFSEAEKSLDPISLRNVTWEGVKKYLLENEQKLTEIFWQL